MTNVTKTARAADSLLDEIEELEVLEAEELQEGVAFHAFQFKQASPMEALAVVVNAEAATVLGAINLPQGATLLDVEGDTINIVYDAQVVNGAQLQEQLSQALKGQLVNIQPQANQFQVTKL